MNPRNFVLASISAGSAALMAFVYFFAAKCLGTDAFGVFSYALALAMFGETLTDIGIHQLTVREVAKAPDTRFALFRQQLPLKAMTGLTMLVVLFLGSLFFDSTPSTLVVVAVMLVSAVFRSFLLSVRGGLLGIEAFGIDTALVLGDRVVLTIVCTAALLAGVGVLGLALVFLGTRVATVAVAFMVARPHLGPPTWRFEPDAWAALQRRALPLGTFMMALTAYNYVDTVMLKGMTTSDETGLYNAAYRIYEGVTYAAAALSAVLTPRLASLWATSRPGHARLARLGLAATIAMAVPLGAILWVWASFWMVLLPGSAYVAGTGVLRILAAGLPFVFIIWVLHAMATAAGRDQLLIRSTLAGLFANVGLNLWLIPIAGRDGAALATILGEMVTMAMLLSGLWPTLTATAPSESE